MRLSKRVFQVMPGTVRTIVTFESRAFNTVEHKKYFINQGCFGDDVATWLGDQVRSKGYEADRKPGQEDFGWYFNFRVSEVGYCFVVGFRPADEQGAGEWIGWLERQRGVIGSLIGGRKRSIELAAAKVLHEIISASPEIRNIRWHYQGDFNAGREELGTRAPDGA